MQLREEKWGPELLYHANAITFKSTLQHTKSVVTFCFVLNCPKYIHPCLHKHMFVPRYTGCPPYLSGCIIISPKISGIDCPSCNMNVCNFQTWKYWPPLNWCVRPRPPLNFKHAKCTPPSPHFSPCYIITIWYRTIWCLSYKSMEVTYSHLYYEWFESHIVILNICREWS